MVDVNVISFHHQDINVALDAEREVKQIFVPAVRRAGLIVVLLVPTSPEQDMGRVVGRQSPDT